MRDTYAPARVRNCIIGGVLGDAWAARFDLAAPLPGLLPSIPGLSDDTWLALATCEAIARDGGGVDPGRVAGVFVDWFERGRFHGTGSAALDALRDLAAGAHWSRSGAHGEHDMSAGAAMRAAPLAMMLDPASDTDRELICDFVRITHHADEVCSAALAVVATLRACFAAGTIPSDLPRTAARELPESRVRDTLDEVERFSGGVAEASGRFGTDNLTDAIAMAMVAATRHPADFDAALDAAASAARDPAAAAALTGQILGAGGCDLPPHRVEALPDRDVIDRALEPFVELVGRTGPS